MGICTIRLTLLSLLSVFFAFAAIAGSAGKARACPNPCAVAGGTYQVLEPDGWDRKSPLPVIVWFHGFQRSGTYVVNSPRVGGQTRKNGVLLVAPDGLNKAWSVRNAPRDERDELAFVEEILDDIRARWPVDESRLWAAGFSLGGSLTWDIACRKAGLFKAYFPVSGSFWAPIPEDCATAPARIRHVHGMKDKVMPLEGRVIREQWRQGNLFQGFDLWKAENRCAAEPNHIYTDGNRQCRVWSACGAGTEMQLCLHDGGHIIPLDWISSSIAWANGLPPG
ncbi:alpha/beta hydrolase family esterase [Hwanghaeella sp.]|uniref:alpha/beta hydrolase family esterase n=1 Tax=Hwanghaeella sp. TaxID=2605943 RepID=UPI003CCC24A3